jgi:hypothetical protein
MFHGVKDDWWSRQSEHALDDASFYYNCMTNGVPRLVQMEEVEEDMECTGPPKRVPRIMRVKGSTLNQKQTPGNCSCAESEQWLAHISSRQLNMPRLSSNYMCGSTVQSKQDVPAVLELITPEQMPHYVNLNGPSYFYFYSRWSSPFVRAKKQL